MALSLPSGGWTVNEIPSTPGPLPDVGSVSCGRDCRGWQRPSPLSSHDADALPGVPAIPFDETRSSDPSHNLGLNTEKLVMGTRIDILHCSCQCPSIWPAARRRRPCRGKTRRAWRRRLLLQPYPSSTPTPAPARRRGLRPLHHPKVLARLSPSTDRRAPHTHAAAGRPRCDAVSSSPWCLMLPYRGAALSRSTPLPRTHPAARRSNARHQYTRPQQPSV